MNSELFKDIKNLFTSPSVTYAHLEQGYKIKLQEQIYGTISDALIFIQNRIRPSLSTEKLAFQ